MRKNESGVAHLAIFAVVILALVVGAGVYVARSQSDTETVSNRGSSSREVVSLVDPLPTELLSIEQVRTLASEDVEGAQLSGVELEKEGTNYVYKVKLANGRVLFYNAQTGDVVTGSKSSNETESESSDNALAGDFNPTITFAQAREIALAKVPGGTVRKIELETEHGRVVYSVRFVGGSRVDVSAEDGSVVRTKIKKTKSSSKSNSDKKSNDSTGDSGLSNSGGSNSGSTGTDDNPSQSDLHDERGSGSSDDSSGRNRNRGGSDDNN